LCSARVLCRQSAMASRASPSLKAAQPHPRGGPASRGAPSSHPVMRVISDARGKMRLLHYSPVGEVRGLVVLAPGSRGGMGPGQLPATIGKFDPTIRCIYTLLAHHLMSKHGLAVCHFHWRQCPTRKGAPPGTLKSPETLRDGASDVALAARFLRSVTKTGDNLPLVLLGFSFGSPAVLAAAALSCAAASRRSNEAEPAFIGPLAGVISLSGGLRVAVDGTPEVVSIGDKLKGGASRSRPKEYGGVDSEGCVAALASAGVPLLLTHGLSDVTVDPGASKAIYDVATGPKAILWLEGADHHCRARFDELLDALSRWVPALVHQSIDPSGSVFADATAARLADELRSTLQLGDSAAQSAAVRCPAVVACGDAAAAQAHGHAGGDADSDRCSVDFPHHAPPVRAV